MMVNSSSMRWIFVVLACFLVVAGMRGEAFSQQIPALQQKMKSPSDPENGRKFGTELSFEGDLLVVSAQGDVQTQQGAVFIFESSQQGGDDWTLVKTLHDEGVPAHQDTYYGWTTQLAGDLLAVSSHRTLPYDSSVYIYDRAQDWAQIARLEMPVVDEDGERDTRLSFGRYLQFDGSTLVASVGPNQSVRSIYIYDRDESDPTQWNEVTILSPATPNEENWGESISMDGDTLAVGSVNGVYIYARNQGGQNHWGQVTRVEKPDAAPASSVGFGTQVSLSGSELAVGAWGDESEGERAGAVYLFKQQGDQWHFDSKLLASNSMPKDRFGNSVKFGGPYLLVHASDGYKERPYEGTLYVFMKNSAGQWEEVTKLVGESPERQSGWFGVSGAYAINGDMIVVGDSFMDYPQGAVYLFGPSDELDDSDGDGVPNADDDCPKLSASTQNGCPEGFGEGNGDPTSDAGGIQTDAGDGPSNGGGSDGGCNAAGGGPSSVPVGLFVVTLFVGWRWGVRGRTKENVC